MSDFRIGVPDATSLSKGYEAMQGKADEAVQSTMSAIAQLEYLQSFSGFGAQAIKQYFREVHVSTLLPLISELSLQLLSDYCQYYNKVQDAAQNDSAGWFPNVEMERRAEEFARYAGSDIGSIKSDMSKATQAGPDGYPFSTPSGKASNLSRSLKGLSTQITRTLEHLEESEQLGVSLFEQDSKGLYAQAFSALSSAIARCNSGSLTPSTYQAGDFARATADLNLPKLQQAMEDSLAEHADEIENTLIATDANFTSDLQDYIDSQQAELYGYMFGGAEIGAALSLISLAIAVGKADFLGAASAASNLTSSSYTMYQSGRKVVDKQARSESDEGDPVQLLVDGFDLGTGAADVVDRAVKIAYSTGSERALNIFGYALNATGFADIDDLDPQLKTALNSSLWFMQSLVDRGADIGNLGNIVGAFYTDYKSADINKRIDEAEKWLEEMNQNTAANRRPPAYATQPALQWS